MKSAECGQITVFLSLLLLSFLLIISVCVEGIYIRMKQADFMENQLLLGDYALANYHKDLLEQFHVFGIDGRYYSKMEGSLKNVWERECGSKPVSLSLSEPVSIADDTGAVLKHQIREYMKYAEVTSLLERLKTSFRGVENDADVKQLKQKIDNVDETKIKETSKEKDNNNSTAKQDPREGLKKILSKDVLEYMLPAGKSVSKEKVAIVYGKKTKYSRPKVNFFQKKSVKKLFPESQKGAGLSGITTEGLTTLYVAKNFGNALHNVSKSGVLYETEYVIAGHDTDRDNLKSVIGQLMLIRFAVNYSYLLSSSAKQMEAYTLATAIANVTTIVPGVVEGIKMLLLAAWAYGESVVDLRGLLAGKKIAIVKDVRTWQLSLANLGTINGQAVSCSNGISYEDYLKILLMMQLDTKLRYRRMMDVMELRIKQKQPDFSLASCVFSYRMQLEEKYPLLFYTVEYPVRDSRIYSY